MRSLIILLLPLFALLLCRCTHPVEVQPELVVEGWIDAGGHPLVMLHKSLTFDEPVDSVEQVIADKLVYFGKVTISDGSQSVILTGRLDTTLLPPYRYSTVEIIGEPGKTYTLTAEYDGHTATAVTTIPQEMACLDSIVVRRKAGDAGAMDIRIYPSHRGKGKGYYALFYRYMGEKQYVLCFNGVFTDEVHSLPVYHDLAAGTIGQDSVQVLFRQDDRIELKVVRLDVASYDFWRTFASITTTSGMAFMPVYGNILSNITGGKGYWCGYAGSVYPLRLNRDTTYRY